MDIRKKFQIGDIVARTKEFMDRNPNLLNTERRVVGYDQDGDYLLVETEGGGGHRQAETMMVVERNGFRIGERVLVGEVCPRWTQGVIEGFTDEGLAKVSIISGYGRVGPSILFENPIKYVRELEGKPAVTGGDKCDQRIPTGQRTPCAAGIMGLSGAAMDKLISDTFKVGGTVSAGEPLASKWKGDLWRINYEALTGSKDDRLSGKEAYVTLVDALANYNAIAEEVKDAPQFKLVTK